MKIQVLTCLMPLLFFVGNANACRVTVPIINFSPVPMSSGFTGGAHSVPLGPIVGSLTRTVQHGEVFAQCGPRTYFAEYNGAFGPSVEHYGNPKTIVYQLPGAPGFGVSYEVSDPQRDWDQLATPRRQLIHGDFWVVGFRARVQVHIIGDITSGQYTIPRTKVGEMTAVRSNSATQTVELFSPQITINVDVNSCELQVPSNVKLDNDISKPTPFEVMVTRCNGRVEVYSRFSDAKKPTDKGTSLQNSGSAQGYVLRLETENGKPVQIIPTGTNREDGEISMGVVGKGGSALKKFQARVVKEGDKQQPGTLEFDAIVGVAYR